MQHEIFVEPDGRVVFIHDDDLADALVEGAADTRRASHVEPAAGWCPVHHKERDGLCGLDCDRLGEGWVADLFPVGGPVLGPYDRRGQALAAELRWLSLQLNAGLIRGES